MSCAPRFSAHGRPAGRIQGAIASRGAAQAPEGSAMKPPAFDYHRPESVDETLALLANVGDDGKVLAGGQSLVPILNMRLASPVHLVDINRLADLAYVRAEPDGVRVARGDPQPRYVGRQPGPRRPRGGAARCPGVAGRHRLARERRWAA